MTKQINKIKDFAQIIYEKKYAEKQIKINKLEKRIIL